MPVQVIPISPSGAGAFHWHSCPTLPALAKVHQDSVINFVMQKCSLPPIRLFFPVICI